MHYSARFSSAILVRRGVRAPSCSKMRDADFTDREANFLKRELKKAKVHEVGRIVRRIRQLRNKKGTAAQIQKNNRKASRFEKELEFIKEAEVSGILNQLSGSDNEDEVPSCADFELKKRALQRLVRSVPIQSFLNKKNSGELENTQGRLQKNSCEGTKRQREMALPSPKSKPKGLASVFLTSMLSTSASSEQQRTSSTKKGKLNGKSKNAKGKAQAKNRMGQRTRKKLWESMYGSKAKHVQERNTQEGKSGNEIKSKDVKQRSRQKANHGDNSVDEKLHPSWQATKKKKLEQSINVEFKGKKTKFDEDSD